MAHMRYTVDQKRC